MVVGEVPESVDLLVVGGGPGGYVAAIGQPSLAGLWCSSIETARPGWAVSA